MNIEQENNKKHYAMKVKRAHHSQADKYMNRDFYDKSMKFGTQLGHAI